MSGRGLGTPLLLAVAGAVAGAAAGFGLATLAQPEPRSLGEVEPLAASSPAFPTDPPVRVLPDPATPPLEPAIPVHVERVGQSPFGLRLPVPDGWVRSNPKAGEWRWFVEDNPMNTYVLRVVLPSGYSTIDGAIDARLEALEGATGIRELTVEARTDDTFVASYVSENHRRLTMERYLSLDGSRTVYVALALVGRTTDREGMADLLERVTDGAARR